MKRYTLPLLGTALLLGACLERELPTALSPEGMPSLSTDVACGENRVAELIQAIADANEREGADVIELAAGCTYTLTSVNNVPGYMQFNGLPIISGDLTINGNGARIERSTAGGTHDFRIFQIASGTTVIISGLTIASGDARYDGGGISNSGTLTLAHSTVSGSTAPSGGGIFNSGTLTLTHSTVSGNTAVRGGGIANIGTLALSNSTVSGNGAGGPSGNLGGGIFNSGTLTLTNSTVSGNLRHAGVLLGGGIANEHPGTLTLTHSTVSNNSASTVGGIFRAGGTLTLRSSLVAGNTDSDLDLNSGSATVSYSLIGSAARHNIADGTHGNIVGVTAADLALGPLANNGGPTETHALLSGSPAIDAGSCTDPNGATVAADQRGVSRPQGAACDIGAFELVQQAPPSPVGPVLAFFDLSVTNGSLVGSGSGASAQNRLGALRNMLTTAADLLAQNDLAGACGQLLQAQRRTDGSAQPPDFAAGDAAAQLAAQIQALRGTLGCAP